ncbi:MAG: hypothetical protein J6W16_03005 [Methanobrevibacter sp.]|nr:hypothetical protein [Methanobrevibacter sp.]MBP5427477.1 hypothetical protein [Clostridiales bacterium]MBP5784537.1 hypothetical protein [Methanobrevibacter sp.]
MKYISIKQMFDDIRLNSYKIGQLNPQGIIGIPRSGLMAATLLSQELHIGVCSINEFIDNNGQEHVFYHHGHRQIEHNNSNIFIILEDSCYNGSMIEHVKALKSTFPDKIFISACIYLEGPCKVYKPDIALVDIRKEVLNNAEMPVALYQYNLLDNYWNFKFLYDLDGVMCIDPPCDINTEAYENYLLNPIKLHIPITPSNNPISICTYRLNKYERETRRFLDTNKVKCKDLFMFPSASKEIRALTQPAYYKAQHYKDNKYLLFIESNDQEAQQICRLSQKPVYCYSTGNMYKWHG